MVCNRFAVVVRFGVGTEWLTLLGRAPQEIDYTNRVAELQGESKDFSARTLRRYYQAWLLAGKDRMALVPRVARAGQSRGARKSSLLEKHPQIRKLVDEAIQAVCLTKARRPISAVTRRVLEDLQRLNSRLPAAQAVPIPRQSALSRAIARRIGQLDPWEVDRQRWGRKIADRRARRGSPTPPKRPTVRSPARPGDLRSQAVARSETGHSAAGRDGPQPAESRRRHGCRSHRPAVALAAHRLLQPHGRGLLFGLRAALVCRAHESFAARHSAIP